MCRERLEKGAIAFVFRGCCPNKKGRGSFIFCWTEIKKESLKKRRKLKKRRRGGLLSLSFSFISATEGELAEKRKTEEEEKRRECRGKRRSVVR